MDTTRPYQQLAAQFQISDESAKYFLGQVQKSFTTQKPPHALILEFMAEQPLEVLPTPYEVAEQMHESGRWPYPLKAPPPLLADDEDLYF